jgi:hypothetical protein
VAMWHGPISRTCHPLLLQQQQQHVDACWTIQQ